MVTETVLEVEGELAVSPPYAALNEWVPTLNVLTASVPVALDRVEDPIAVLPS
jgi:hypothetical protein